MKYVFKVLKKLDGEIKVIVANPNLPTASLAAVASGTGSVAAGNGFVSAGTGVVTAESATVAALEMAKLQGKIIQNNYIIRKISL